MVVVRVVDRLCFALLAVWLSTRRALCLWLTRAITAFVSSTPTVPNADERGRRKEEGRKEEGRRKEEEASRIIVLRICVSAYV